jgi:hypothetical protein
MPIDRRRELFPRLCEVGNALEALRDQAYHQGTLWLQLDAVLRALDALIDTRAEAPPAACPGTPSRGGWARKAAGEGEA